MCGMCLCVHVCVARSGQMQGRPLWSPLQAQPFQWQQRCTGVAFLLRAVTCSASCCGFLGGQHSGMSGQVHGPSAPIASLAGEDRPKVQALGQGT